MSCITSNEMQQVKDKHPGNIPVLLLPLAERLLNRTKFLCPQQITLAQFIHMIRGRYSLESDEGIFIFIDGQLPPTTATLLELHGQYKDPSGLLNLKYSKESAFGWS